MFVFQAQPHWLLSQSYAKYLVRFIRCFRCVKVIRAACHAKLFAPSNASKAEILFCNSVRVSRGRSVSFGKCTVATSIPAGVNGAVRSLLYKHASNNYRNHKHRAIFIFACFSYFLVAKLYSRASITEMISFPELSAEFTSC